jgi:hypothetical protein
MFAPGGMRFWVADRHPFLTLPPRSAPGFYDITELLYDDGVIFWPILDTAASISWNCEASPFIRTMSLRRGGTSSIEPPGSEFLNPAEANLRMSLRGAQENFKPGRLTLELTIPRFTSMRRSPGIGLPNPIMPTVFPPLTTSHDFWERDYSPGSVPLGATLYALAINALVEAAYYHRTLFIVGSDVPDSPRDLFAVRKPVVKGKLVWGSNVWSFPAKAISINDQMDRFTLQLAATNDIQRKANGYIITVPKFIRIPAFGAFEEEVLIWDVRWQPIEEYFVTEELV